MTHCSIQNKNIERYRCLSFVRNSSDKYGKQLLDTAKKIGVNQ